MKLQSRAAALALAAASPVAPSAAAAADQASAQAQPSQPEPLLPLASYISEHDYPVDAISKRQQGTVRFRLSVDAEGKVTGCTILRSSRSPSLDATSCQLMAQRARFRPARDASGTPVPGTFVTGIQWVYPKVLHDERVERTYAIWLNCAVAQADKLARTKLNLHRLTRTALAKCAGEEDDAARAVGAEIWLIPARNSVRRAIAARVAAVRRRPAAAVGK